MRTFFTKFKQPYRAPISSQFFNDKRHFILYNAEYLYGTDIELGKLDEQILDLKPSITASAVSYTHLTLPTN